jgi:hypothetical protein
MRKEVCESLRLLNNMRREKQMNIKRISNKFFIVLLKHFHRAKALSFLPSAFRLIHHFVCAATAGKGFRLGFESKTHSQDVSHCFA